MIGPAAVAFGRKAGLHILQQVLNLDTANICKSGDAVQHPLVRPHQAIIIEPARVLVILSQLPGKGDQRLHRIAVEAAQLYDFAAGLIALIDISCGICHPYRLLQQLQLSLAAWHVIGFVHQLFKTHPGKVHLFVSSC
ncbi:hypothetical protein D3C75_903880 [compost metagenome]